MASQMLKAQGKVETVFVKALPEKDKFENTHRASIKLDDGQWYGMGSIKSDTLTVENDEGNWVPLGEGTEVILKYTKNGDFNNSKRSDMMILNLVTGEKKAYSGKSAASSGGTSGSTGGGGVDWARKDAGAAASASLDKALRLLIAEGGPGQRPTDAQLLEEAKRMNRLVSQIADWILEGGDEVNRAPVENTKPAATNKPKARRHEASPRDVEKEADVWVDEEVPF